MSKSYSFAHLIGLATRGAKASEDDDKGDARRAEGPLEDNPGDEENAKGKKADGDDDLDPDADEDEKEPKGKKAKKAEDPDKDPDAEDEDNKESAKAVRADRQRCAAIIAFGMANGCAEQAGALAFDTNLGKTAAINVLKAGGSRGGRTPAAALDRRMAALNVPQVGPEASGGQLPAGMSSVAAGIIKAGQ